ncbi:MAG: 2-oxoglutarate dehydrogenase complex dihydrolipoyllysine-residue succinyltransferase [Acidobacteria bacterium]|nr:2-oxoglutarate dehydrogenase complex dihydrolipoyllysine-residue succinyltransferase [Acidobacteriota bacterium]
MVVNIVVPELGESVVEARIARWLKKEGDQVALGEALVELETEKIDLEVSADRAGQLTSIKHPEGADVKVGEVLALLDPSKAAAAAAPTTLPPAAAPATVESAAPKATPAAKNVAKEHAVSLAAVPASGPRVTKQDVREFVAASTPPAAAKAAPAAAPAPRPTPAAPGDRTEERVRMTKRRATIARRLVEAQRTAAMLTTFNEVDMTAVMDIRARRKEAFTKKYGVNLGLTSFFVKAVVGALKAFPAINAEIQGDEIVYKHYYDIGMAVGAEGGLVVPVLRDADRMGFADIELGIRDFAARANNGSLTLEDLKGGTFTITNGGVFGSMMSTPILNPPQVGILGLHKIADRAVPVNGQVVIRPMMYLALSYDHRIVDGREAVQFLVKVKDFIEDPAWLLIEG